MQNRSLLLPSVVLIVLFASSAQAQFQAWSGSSIVNDPEWQRHFLGTYGFLSGAEPDIRADEIELLREVIETMKVNPSAAAIMLSQSVADDSSAALDFILANLHFQTGDHDQAMVWYEKALKKFPDFRRAHKNLGLLLVQKSRHADAVSHLARAVELGERDGRSFGLMGFCYLSLGNPVAAEAAYRSAILQQPATRDWKLGLARALLDMEKHQEASALFATLIENDPDDATSWLLQANALVGLDRPLDAAVNLEAVRMMGRAQVNSLVLLGDIYMNAGMHALAASAYLDAIRSDGAGSRFGAWVRAAEQLMRTGAYDEAEQLLDSIDEQWGKTLASNDELRVLTLRARLERSTGREVEAAKRLESIVSRDGTRGDALLELAAYNRDHGREEKALLLIERAEKLEAYEYRALLEHAQILVSGRKYAKAAEKLRRALRIQHEPRVERFLTRVTEAIRRS